MKYPMALVVLALAVPLCRAQATPWWDDFPRIVETGDLATAQSHHANIGMNAAHNDPGWGLWSQKIGMNTAKSDAFHNAGLKNISYYETFGQSYCYLVELGPVNAEGLTSRLAHHWNWQIYGGGPYDWAGVHSWWDDLAYARPLTRTHARYGGPALTYPDGTIATGYMGAGGPDPRNSRVFDACASKDLWGNISLEYNYNSTINALDNNGDPVGPLDGTLAVNGQYASLVTFHKDSACAAWNDYTYASTLQAADNGMDGMWTDNFGPWDSFGNPPLKHAFGDWSVARFRDYLAVHFTSTELTAMGVSDPATFDVREGLKQTLQGWGGNPNDVNDPKWKDARWLDDPLWLAYIIFKRQAGTEALEAYYDAAKTAAADAGNNAFFIAGNDIPGFNLGWARGRLDMVSTEVSTGWSLDGGPRGFMTPPMGRLTPRYKLAREHALSRFVNVWLYTDGDPALAQPGLSTTMYYEMLAAHTLPMFHPANPRVAGTTAGNTAFFSFVESATPSFGDRIPVEDVGIFYSSSSILQRMVPGGFYSHGTQPHQFAVYGWGTALGEMHHQYRYIPQWKLDAKILEGLRLLIIPNAQVMDPALVTSVITPWVNGGGKLIVTGDSGVRLEEGGNFAVNPSGTPLAALIAPDGPVNVWYLADNWGMDFYNATTTRPTLLAAMRADLDTFLAGELPRLVEDGGTVPDSVGLTYYIDQAAVRCFIDANNFNFDSGTDSPIPTASITFDMDLPAWLPAPTAAKLAPDAGPSVSIQVLPGGRGRVTVGAFANYVSVVLMNDTPTPTPTETEVWVDFDYTGPEVGGPLQPLTQLAEGARWTADNGTVKVKAGSTTETPRLARAMRVEANGGTVRIGVAP